MIVKLSYFVRVRHKGQRDISGTTVPHFGATSHQSSRRGAGRPTRFRCGDVRAVSPPHPEAALPERRGLAPPVLRPRQPQLVRHPLAGFRQNRITAEVPGQMAATPGVRQSVIARPERQGFGAGGRYQPALLRARPEVLAQALRPLQDA